LVLGLFIYLLYRFNIVIKPFILAVILAFVLAPLANWFQARMKIHRGVATLISYLVLFVVVAAILALLFPPLAEQATNFNLDFQRMVGELESVLGSQYTWLADINLETVPNSLTAWKGVLEPVVGQTLSIIFGYLHSWVIFIAVVILPVRWPALSQWMENRSLAYQGLYSHPAKCTRSGGFLRSAGSGAGVCNLYHRGTVISFVCSVAILAGF
jgi:hypothetical protein